MNLQNNAQEVFPSKNSVLQVSIALRHSSFTAWVDFFWWLCVVLLDTWHLHLPWPESLAEDAFYLVDFLCPSPLDEDSESAERDGTGAET